VIGKESLDSNETSCKDAASPAKVQLIRPHIFRAIVLWIALHVFVSAASSDRALTFSTSTSLALVAIAGIVGFLDARRRHETVMLGNLGIPRFAPSVTWAGTVLILEILIGVSAAMIGK
jgi:hypothetical protein